MIGDNGNYGYFGGPNGPRNMHWANGRRIKELQAARGMTQAVLAAKAGICVRKLRQMQVYERVSKLWLIESVAHALGVPLWEIQGVPEASLRCTHSWEKFPIPLRDPRPAREALRRDMNSDFDGALDVLQGGLAQLDPADPDDLRDWAYLCLKRDSIRSNAGKNTEALDGLDGLLDAHGRSLSGKPTLVGLIELQRGIILRRMDRFDDAAVLFAKVQPVPICEPAASHHLGVLAALTAGSNVDSPFFAAAQRHFQRSLAAWTKGRGCYRAAFSESRLGQLRVVCGDYLGAKLYFYSAFLRFESDGCSRYMVAIRRLINELP